MIAHTTLPVSDYRRSKSFYIKVLKPLGYRNNMDTIPTGTISRPCGTTTVKRNEVRAMSQDRGSHPCGRTGHLHWNSSCRCRSKW
jgi:catechol 2,3-dioxygenase-like lactoylglutathione lyase family enzyme